MKNRKGWLILAGAFYLFYLVWMVPAGLCWSWWAARPGSGAGRVTLVDLHGPWSSGNCALLKIGPLQFEQLTWKIRPFSLLRGRLEFALAAGLPDSGKTAATLRLGRRDLEVRNLHLLAPVASLGSALLPGANLTGTLEGRELRLLLAKGLPVEATGQLTWRGAGLSLTGPVAVGDLTMQVQTGANGITANLKDRGGPLRIEIQWGIKPDGSYQLNGEVVPRGVVQPELADLLGLLGPAAADGRVRLARAGRLAPLY